MIQTLNHCLCTECNLVARRSGSLDCIESSEQEWGYSDAASLSSTVISIDCSFIMRGTDKKPLLRSSLAAKPVPQCAWSVDSGAIVLVPAMFLDRGKIARCYLQQ
jgi:hypothetical protein